MTDTPVPAPAPRQATFARSRRPAGSPKLFEQGVPPLAASEKRQATLRCGAASLTATACRASFKHHGGPAREEAR
ncbi:DUF6380 family protein [Streptomyces sp. NPDC093984]|uniref:DUF6380 family protein n=1 Tax=Streptomyces sp. NPDC093984 TaxID=3366052 RepID=UPI00382A1B59